MAELLYHPITPCGVFLHGLSNERLEQSFQFVHRTTVVSQDFCYFHPVRDEIVCPRANPVATMELTQKDPYGIVLGIKLAIMGYLLTRKGNSFLLSYTDKWKQLESVSRCIPKKSAILLDFEVCLSSSAAG